MLGQQLKLLRKSANLTQEELAKKLNITRGTYAHYELDKREPNYEVLTQLSNFFGVSIDYLLGKTNISESASSIDNKKCVLNDKDKKDIAKDVKEIMDKIDSGEDGPLYYNGEEMSQEDKELFKDALEFALKRIKVANKQKYTPKKYR